MGNNIDTGNYSRNNIVEVTSNNIKQSEYRAETYAQKAEKSLLECLSCTSLVQGILNACTEIKENLENLFFTDLDEHKEDNENPHNVTAAQVGTYTKETIDNLLSVKQPVGNYLTEHQDITRKQDAITSSDKLDADLVDDTTSSHKFVSTSDINTWNGKQNTDTAVTHTASTGVGSATKGVYIASDGTATAMTYSVEKDVPSNAVFTDTTYNVMTGADGTSAGASGLVPAPAATDNTKYLKGDGTYDTPTDTTYTFSTGLTESSGTVTVTDYDKLVKNTATGYNAIGIGGAGQNSGNGAISIGHQAQIGTSDSSICIGKSSQTSANSSIAIGTEAKTSGFSYYAYQIGKGTNSTAKTLAIGFGKDGNNNDLEYQLLDGTTGLIPDARLSSNIARTSAIPTVNDGTITITQDGVTKGTFTVNQSGNTTIDLSGGSSDEFEVGNSLQMTEVTFSVPTDASSPSGCRCIAYVNDKFIATAYNSSGYYATSTNGTTWSVSSTYSLRNKYWNGIGYIGGTYVIVSSDGYISTSSNGTSWVTPTQNSNLGSHNWQKIASNGSKLVIISQDGYISTSTDGTTWSAAAYKSALGSNRYWWGITYGNNKFVALSTGGYISTSEDGETWTSAVQNSNLGNISWRGLSYNNGKYIAIASGTGTSNYGSISTSTDGTTWVAAYVNSSLKQKINWDAGIAYGNSKFVAMGSTGFTSYWDGVTTTDRLDVIVDLNLSNPSNNPVSSSAVNTALNQKQGTLSVVSPLSLTNNSLRLTMDTQLSTTSTRPLTNSAITNAINSIDIPEYHEGTSISITQSPAVFDFSSLTSVNTGGSESWNDITYNDGVYIAVGDDEQFYHSTNGTTWQGVSGPFESNNLIGVAYDGTGLCYAITNSSYVYEYTYDSVMQDFMYTNMVQVQPVGTYSSIAYGNGLFVISGRVHNEPFIAYGDGVNAWNVVNLFFSVGTINKVIYDGTRFVAACSNGEIGISTDGSTWTFSQVNSISDNITTIAYDTTTYIAMVGTNTILKSTDLTNWTETTEQTMDNISIKRSAACNGCFAFIAQTSSYDYVLYTSTDGNTWATHSFSNDYNIFESPRCIAYCDDNFLFGFDYGGMYKVNGTSVPIISCVVDSQLSLLSDNPVKNSVIAAAIGDIETLLSQV